MPRFKVLITDYAWPDLHVEEKTLAEVDAELIVPPVTDAATLGDLAQDADAIMTNWASVNAAVIERTTRCRIISRLGIGLDNIDLAAAKRRNIIVTNVPDYCLTEVAEHTLALLLALARGIGLYHHQTKTLKYDLSAGPELRRIEGQRLGLIGYGNIGRRVATKAAALGLKVVATSRTPWTSTEPAAYLPLEELLRQSDYVSLHVPLRSDTQRMIAAAQLAMMKPTAYLINTSRGGLVDQAALAQALVENRIAGAGLDVHDPEPPPLDRAPWNDPRVIITPHAAFVSTESLANLRVRAARQVADCLAGRRPENIVN